MRCATGTKHARWPEIIHMNFILMHESICRLSGSVRRVAWCRGAMMQRTLAKLLCKQQQMGSSSLQKPKLDACVLWPIPCVVLQQGASSLNSPDSLGSRLRIQIRRTSTAQAVARRQGTLQHGTAAALLLLAALVLVLVACPLRHDDVLSSRPSCWLQGRSRSATTVRGLTFDFMLICLVSAARAAG